VAGADEHNVGEHDGDKRKSGRVHVSSSNGNRQKENQRKNATRVKRTEGTRTKPISAGPGCIRSMYRLNDAGSRLHDHAKRDRRKKGET
jgi:hypothetical protein